jgi:hypothetical protein
MSARNALACALALAVSACAALAVHPGELELETGVRVYENGRFADATQYLQRSLDLGLGKSDQAVAHKYLAFIHCSAGREAQCTDEFKLALSVRPSFELGPAEAGHPTWGPVFRTIKYGR